MGNHKTIWGLTLAVAILALTVLFVRSAGVARKLEVGQGNGNSDASIDSMIRLLQKDPRVRLSATRSAVEAVAALAERVDPPPATVIYAVALRLHYGTSDMKGAEGAYRDAAALDGEWAWPQNGLGIVLFETGRENEGLLAFEAAMTLAPTWARPHSDLAILYRLAGKLEEAAGQGLEALELEPNLAAAHNNYGVILDMQGKLGEAQTRYAKAAQLDPSLPTPYYNLASALARQGQVEAAARHLSKALALDEAFREEALGDPDFADVIGTPTFRNLMGLSTP